MEQMVAASGGKGDVDSVGFHDVVDIEQCFDAAFDFSHAEDVVLVVAATEVRAFVHF